MAEAPGKRDSSAMATIKADRSRADHQPHIERPHDPPVPDRKAGIPSCFQPRTATAPSCAPQRPFHSQCPANPLTQAREKTAISQDQSHDNASPHSTSQHSTARHHPCCHRTSARSTLPQPNHVMITQHGPLKISSDAELHQRRPLCLLRSERQHAYWPGTVEAGQRHADLSQSQRQAPGA
jgi:hypothetical protein